MARSPNEEKSVIQGRRTRAVIRNTPVRRCNVVGGTGKNFDEREERDKERELGLEGRNVRIVYEARVGHSVGSGSGMRRPRLEPRRGPKRGAGGV